MNNNSMATIILCSQLCLNKEIKPFTTVEWSKLVDKLIELSLEPSDLINFEVIDLEKYFSKKEVERIVKLRGRSGSIPFEISKYAQSGIKIVTRSDPEYPKMIKRKLRKNSPPLFYYSGDLSICNKPSIGFVGSRNVDEDDIEFTQNTALKSIKSDYAIVSGGARGVDSISVETALKNNGTAIEYLCNDLIKKVRKKDVIIGIRNKQLLLLSLAKPDARFNAGMAMARNKFIYAQSEATVVVRSDYNKGGTWTGAKECLRHEYSKILCWDNSKYDGNQELINEGAFPINENWQLELPTAKTTKKNNVPQAEQLSLFD